MKKTISALVMAVLVVGCSIDYSSDDDVTTTTTIDNSRVDNSVTTTTATGVDPITKVKARLTIDCGTENLVRVGGKITGITKEEVEDFKLYIDGELTDPTFVISDNKEVFTFTLALALDPLPNGVTSRVVIARLDNQGKLLVNASCLRVKHKVVREDNNATTSSVENNKSHSSSNL